MSAPEPEAAAGARVPYAVETERLLLRCYEPADAEPLMRAVLESQEHLAPWMPWAVDPPRDLDAQLAVVRRFRGDYDLGQQYVWAALAREDGAWIGGCGLHPRVGPGGLEIGYWVHVDHVGRGYATEMAAAATRVGFELFRMQRMEIRCEPANRASARVPEKLGYRLEGTLRRRLEWPGAPRRDAMVWTLLAEEYFDSPAAGCVLEARDALGRGLL